MKKFMVDLADVQRFREPNRKLTTAQLVGSVELKPDDADPKTVLVYYNGEPVGALPRKGNLCKLILAGAKAGHASWQSFGEADSDGYPLDLRIRVVLVEEGEHYEVPPLAEPKLYPVGIVGEANYQHAICLCSIGQRIELQHEPDNPFDELALAVVTKGGETIGYIARDSWLRDAIHVEGHGCDATIKSVSTGEPRGVVLQVALNGLGVATRQYVPPVMEASSPQPSRTERKGWLFRILGL